MQRLAWLAIRVCRLNMLLGFSTSCDQGRESEAGKTLLSDLPAFLIHTQNCIYIIRQTNSPLPIGTITLSTRLSFKTFSIKSLRESP